ncbi:MAG TPA: alkaline phosphatase family protein, partial [Solirubrobacteraceae bacterium]|nr:alkaline phosphatase family protein [Solirubrobacteraceae bacterium]
MSAGGVLWRAASAAASTIRVPDSLPDPRRPAGTPTAALPFDHIVVVMMENHSFDNLLGALAHSGQPKAQGLKFSTKGIALNSNPGAEGPVRSFPFPTTAQGPHVSQSWNATHEQIDEGKMDGFVRSVGDRQPMGYWTQDVLPFAYSLARTFCVANRWFGSAPCQTYPNRRFLMAGTAYGNISTDTESLLDPPPPNGTIWDRLHHYGISWRNYFTDLPSVGVIGSTVEKYPQNLSPIAQFFTDLAANNLPSVSIVDPEFGVAGEVGGPLSELPALQGLGLKASETGGSEENPQDMAYGEYWASQIVKGVLASPAWPRTLLIYT